MTIRSKTTSLSFLALLLSLTLLMSPVVNTAGAKESSVCQKLHKKYNVYHKRSERLTYRLQKDGVDSSPESQRLLKKVKELNKKASRYSAKGISSGCNTINWL